MEFAVQKVKDTLPGEIVEAVEGSVTAEAIGEKLKSGYDGLCLVCHGRMDALGKPYLLLETPARTRVRVPGADLVKILESLHRVAGDWWRPVLYSRLKNGRLWYQAGVRLGVDDQEFWDAVKSSIVENACTPVLGPGLTEYRLGSRRDLALRWASKLRFSWARDPKVRDLAYLWTANNDARNFSLFGDPAARIT